MSTRILFLPPDGADDARLLDLDDGGRVRAQATLAPNAAAPAAPDARRTVLVVPGGPVRIEQLPLAAHSEAQALAAARALLAGRLARPAVLHVVLDADHGAAVRTVAAVEADTLRGWLAQAAAFGLRPDAAVPEALLLPGPEAGAMHLFDAGDRWLVRGDGLAFSAEPGLARRVLGDREPSRMDGGFEQLAARALQLPLDLLQGDFAPAAAGRRPAGRRLAWLAVALAASPLLLLAAQALRLELAARALESRAAAVLDAALPEANGGAATADTSDDQAGRLRAVREPRAFAAASAALFAAVAARPGTHLVELEYARGDRLRARLFHRDASDLEALRGALRADDWELVEGGSVDVAGGLHTALVLEPAA